MNWQEIDTTTQEGRNKLNEVIDRIKNGEPKKYNFYVVTDYATYTDKAAFLIDHMTGIIGFSPDEFRVKCWDEKGIGESEADTLPLAICKAWLTYHDHVSKVMKP